MSNTTDGTKLFHKLADRGYTILPIAPCSKVPSKYDPKTESWIPYKGWSTITNDAAKIDIWRTWPAPGVGSTTGEQIVVDLDTMYAPLRDDTMLWLSTNLHLSSLQRQGKAPKLALIYRTDAHITKLRSREFTIEGTKNQLEILGHGQQYIMYGFHPDTKQPYKWLSREPVDVDFKDLPLITAEGIEALIAEFERLAIAYGGVPVSAGVTSNETHISSTSLSDKRNQAASALAFIPNADIHYDEWIRTGMAIKAAFAEDEGTGLELWLDFSEKSHKFDAQKAEHKWGTFHPEKIGAATLYYQAQQNGWVSPNPIPQSNAEDDFGIVSDAEIPVSEKKPNRLFVLRPGEILLDTGRISLIQDTIDPGAMSIMFGESNTGKTFVAMDMAFHIAAGLPWNGKRTQQGNVLYIAAEGGRGAKNRLLALKKQHGPTDFPLYLMPCSVDLLRKDADTKPLIELIKALGIPFSFIVVDTLSRALAGGNENSSDDMGALVQNLDKIREFTNAHIMVIHHSGKDTAKGARGHSLLRAATDTEIEIADNQLKITKQRDMEMQQPTDFTLTTHELGHNNEGDVITSCTVAWGAIIVSDTTNMQDIDYRQLDLLMGLKTAHAQIPAAETIQRKLWYDTALLSGIWPPNQSTAKRYMDAARDVLINRGYVSAGGRNNFKLLKLPDKKCDEIDLFS